MQNLIFAVVIAFGGYWLLRQYISTPATQLAGFTRKIGGVALIAIAGFLTLRGALQMAIPIFILGLGLLGKSGLFPGGFPWGQKSAGQRSRVATSLLAMELDHDSGRLFRMGARPDFEVDIRLGHAQVVEERLAHALVVVLPGMHEEVRELLRAPVHGLDDWRHLHEVWSGADDVDDFHHTEMC